MSEIKYFPMMSIVLLSVYHYQG